MGKLAAFALLSGLAFAACADETPLYKDAKAAPDARAEDLLKRMSQQEKLEYVGGSKEFYIRSIPRLQVPEIKMADGPLGCRNYGPTTAYPAGICGAATWNPERAREMGVALARDSRARGVHIILAPGVNIYRDPRCGRNFEYAGEDPFLAGKIAAAEIQGIQSQGVLATIKHYACNNQETSRGSYSAEIDERTLREIYLPAFKEAVVEGKAACAMNSYNRVNGSYATENAFLNTEILRKEWGFTGIMMSDWGATHDTVRAANGGLDLEMPSGHFMSPAKLQKAIDEGAVQQATIDEKVRRILRTIIAAGFLEREQALKDIPKDAPESAKAALEEAREGIVLLKNQGGLLPFDLAKLKSIAVIGPNSHPAVCGGGGSSRTTPARPVSVLDAIAKMAPSCKVLAGSGVSPSIQEAEATAFYDGPVKLELFKNKDLRGEPALVKEVDKINLTPGRQPPAEGFGTENYSARWTAKITPRTSGIHTFTTLNDDGSRILVDGKRLLSDWNDHAETLSSGSLRMEAGRSYELKVEYYQSAGDATLRFGWGPDIELPRCVELAKGADAVVLCVGFNPNSEGEGFDRQWGLDAGQLEMLKQISQANPRTAVVLFGGGGVDFQGWLDGAPALLHAWYPGQEGGRAIAEILFGATNPSGKLPISIERRLEDNPSFKFFLNKGDAAKGKAVYGEGVFVGYRGYDANGTEPLFPFGFGLSYTSFSYDGLKIEPAGNGGVKASFSVKNCGQREGMETAQLYVAPPKGAVPRPPKELKGFVKVNLKPGESKTLSIELPKDAFAYWSPERKAWTVEPGSYGILVGSSSRDIRLKGACER